MLPLASFALDFYQENHSERFKPVDNGNLMDSEKEINLVSIMHKAITILQFKLEGQLIKSHPEFNMNSRLLLDKINYENNTILINRKEYRLNDSHFPTIDKSDPYKLTLEERELIEKLKHSFLNSSKLQEHTRLLLSKGNMYTIFNLNLLYHGCIPLNDRGEFQKLKIGNKYYNGKKLFDKTDRLVREGYFNIGNFEEKKRGMDFIWYLWCGNNSPLFGKKNMTTFERYYIDDKETHKEELNPFYIMREDENVCRNILIEFGLDPETSHIINGHVPVKVVKGESPIKANGKLLVIDGGFAKAYQCVTGIAGYTLIYNSYGLILASHEPFESTQKAIEEEKDILTTTVVLEHTVTRKRVGDTDIGDELKKQIKELELLLYCYEKGLIKEKVY